MVKSCPACGFVTGNGSATEQVTIKLLPVSKGMTPKCPSTTERVRSRFGVSCKLRKDTAS